MHLPGQMHLLGVTRGLQFGGKWEIMHMKTNHLFVAVILIGLFLLASFILLSATPAGAEIVGKLIWSG